MVRTTKVVAMSILLMGAYCVQGRAQSLPPTILTIDTENTVQYSEDTSDLSKFAAVPSVTTANLPKNFWNNVTIGDIVAVNGQPAKGVRVERSQRVNLATPNAVVPGSAIADVSRSIISEDVFEILKPDGTSIGTIVTLGLGVTGAVPPGAPIAQSTGNSTIVGGTGAFLGARGQLGAAMTGLRNASITEDPASRRQNGGGRVQLVLHVIPMEVPQIAATANGPAVTHCTDYSLVTPSKPAAAGENLCLFASGLGPTVPGVNPGQPFPSNPVAAINSPVQVTVNGNQAQIVGAAGLPGAVDGYQVNFQVPPGTPKGTTSVQLSAAWIQGPAVNIPIQ